MPVRTFHLFLATLTLFLPACRVLPSPPAAAATHAVAKAAVTEQIAARKTSVQRLRFKVDARQSTGHITTTLDPHYLGPRQSHCTCPLRGVVAGELTTRSDGTRTLAIDSIELATTRDGHLTYDWSALVGTIESVIPAGILTIRHNTLPGPFPIDRSGNFARPGTRFTVGGFAKVKGRGLLLKKKVGDAEEDLTIKRTEPVALAGTLVRREGTWILHVPSAVMKDRFDLDDDGSTLDLHFTADITAVAQ